MPDIVLETRTRSCPLSLQQAKKDQIILILQKRKLKLKRRFVSLAMNRVTV